MTSEPFDRRNLPIPWRFWVISIGPFRYVHPTSARSSFVVSNLSQPKRSLTLVLTRWFRHNAVSLGLKMRHSSCHKLTASGDFVIVSISVADCWRMDALLCWLMKTGAGDPSETRLAERVRCCFAAFQQLNIKQIPDNANRHNVESGLTSRCCPSCVLLTRETKQELWQLK